MIRNEFSGRHVLQSEISENVYWTMKYKKKKKKNEEKD